MIKPPHKSTLSKYGLTEELWYNLLNKWDNKCPICLREFTEELRPVVEHYHAPRYKKMKPERKRTFIRGVTCGYCNRRLLVRGMTAEKAYRIFQYLQNFDKRCNE